MKILLTNSIVFNGGEAATVISIVALLRRTFGEDIECLVYDQGSEVARKYYPALKLRLPLFYRATRGQRIPMIGKYVGAVVRARFLLAARLLARGHRRWARLFTSAEEFADLLHYQSADLIISSGGTYLVDNYNIDARVFDYTMTAIFNKPLVFFTQSIGALHRLGHRKRIRPALEQAKLILLRDETSLRHVRNLPVHNPNVHLSADAAFAMVNGHGIKTVKVSSERRRVAISVRRWPYFKTTDTEQGMRRYLQALSAAVEHLVQQHKFDVCFISTCQGIGEYWYDDSEIAAELAASLPEHFQRHVSVDREFRTPQQMIETLEGFDVVIATRFHMAILALAAGVPTVGISYEFKTRELFAGLGIADWEIDLETLNAGDLCERVDRCIAADADRCHQLSEVLEQQRDRVWQAGALLKDVVQAK